MYCFSSSSRYPSTTLVTENKTPPLPFPEQQLADTMSNNSTSSAPQQHHVNYRSNILESLENEFRVIENMDPSCSEGYAVAYDREVPFELRPCQPPPSSPSISVARDNMTRSSSVGAASSSSRQNTGSVSFPPHGTPQPVVQPSSAGVIEGIRVKIVTQNSGGGASSSGGQSFGPCHSMRIELCSDADLFFNYNCVINHIGFNALREDQKLTCDFNEFAVMLMKLFNQAIKDPTTHLCVMIFQPDGRAHLQILQNLHYKFVELLSLPFHEVPEEESRRHINYRYNAIRARLAIMTAKLQDVTALIKVKDSAADGASK